MKLLIDIPKEFEQHFQADKFNDSLHRLSADAHLLAGLYEQEIALMLSEAFKNAVQVQPHGRLVDADAVERNLLKMQQAQTGPCSHGVRKSRAVLRDAPTIIPSDPQKEE